jgi:hypothetical protein
MVKSNLQMENRRFILATWPDEARVRLENISSEKGVGHVRQQATQK